MLKRNLNHGIGDMRSGSMKSSEEKGFFRPRKQLSEIGLLKSRTPTVLTSAYLGAARTCVSGHSVLIYRAALGIHNCLFGTAQAEVLSPFAYLSM